MIHRFIHKSGPFVLEGGKTLAIEQKGSDFTEHIFEFLPTSKGIKLDEDEYFKISDDPKLPE